MKNIRSLLASAVLGLAATSAAFAATSLDRPANLPGPDSIAPIPLKVVHPTDLPPAYRNVTVSVQFTLDQFGKAHNVVAVGDMPKDLANRLLPVVAQWEFTPCRDAKGAAVQRKVVMPLTLVDGAL